MLFKRFSNAIIQTIFPWQCCLCQHRSDLARDLCSVCEPLLIEAGDRCYRCGIFLKDKQEIIHCQTCLEKPPQYDRLCTIFNYETPVVEMITHFKFGRKLNYGRVLGEFLAKKVISEWYNLPHAPLPEAIVPVPLHLSRLGDRGFNQSLELLQPLKQVNKFRILKDSCIKLRRTKSQSKLNATHRKQNLHKVFKVVKPVPYEHIAIMDDIVTTGSTVNALSTVLKEAGVACIDVWCIARA